MVGFTAPRGSRTGFGALHLAQYVDGDLTYTGRAGSGFTDRQLTEVRATLDAMRRRDSPSCVGPIPKEKGITWTEPDLVCEVEFTEWTDEGLLRQPVFLRFRDDKRPEECVRAAGKRGSGAEAARQSRASRDPGRSHSRSRAPLELSPTWTRSSGPTMATPRAT